ncbi:ArnT family glycosyltransferase [Granulicella cerasi]|uniref:ArnT family glycosyltransferase n=1 Tax=Granulicella cerasi TaxID=741063 RepID=A0ABW1Z552_9BACT|nr:glycosyltransferase family 39 protein [Granulicella cerasi]
MTTDLAPSQAPFRAFTPVRRACDRLAQLPSWAIWLFLWAIVAVSHLTLLHLPYYWDEGGYYVPAALDFFHRWTLIPEFTNAHPPLPNVVLGLLWHLTGYHILATRLCAAAFAAAGLTAVFRIGQRLLSPSAGVALTALVAVYPIWFAQSTLAHADIFAAAFTLWAFAFYFETIGCQPLPKLLAIAALFSLAALSKETAIVEPAALAALELYLLARTNRGCPRRFGALSFPVIPLLGWYAYHHHKTGFTFGNPEYLRYNATANFTLQHVSEALRYRFVHLTWQRNLWIPLVFAVAAFLLTRAVAPKRTLTQPIFVTIGVLYIANWLAFSILGGALLTRYLLPVYPLILLVCIDCWRRRTEWWPLLAGLVFAAFASALWINPAVSFAPEDNLTYRDMIRVHEDAAHFVEQHYPNATVLTAWPVAADLFRPDLGYVSQRIKVTSVENFSRPEIQKAAQRPGDFDTAVVFTTHFMSPALQRYLAEHPGSSRGREFDQDRDLTPQEIARMLGGEIVWQEEMDGEWAVVLRFARRYDA